MGTHHLREIPVPAFRQQIDVDVAQDRREAVRVLGLPLRATAPDAEAIRLEALDHPGPESVGMDPAQRAKHEAGAAGQNLHRLRVGDEGPHRRPTRHRVWSEQRERVAMPRMHDGIDGAWIRNVLSHAHPLSAAARPAA
jgi:hypothetical protein